MGIYKLNCINHVQYVTTMQSSGPTQANLGLILQGTECLLVGAEGPQLPMTLATPRELSAPYRIRPTPQGSSASLSNDSHQLQTEALLTNPGRLHTQSWKSHHRARSLRGKQIKPQFTKGSQESFTDYIYWNDSPRKCHFFWAEMRQLLNSI